MNIRILGAHNRETPATKCLSILIDNVLAIDAGALTSSLSITEQKKLEAILLTHQHYDHIRDIPMIALNLYNHGTDISIYSTPDVRDTIETHLLNGKVYPKLHELPEVKPTISFNPMVPYKTERLGSYEVLPIPVNHCNGTVGYQVSDTAGKTIFYAADTGPGLTDCWNYLFPQILFIEATLPNRYEEFALKSGHLTPRLLSSELSKFRELKGYLPQVIIVHMDPALEPDIKEELTIASETLNAPLSIAHEGMQVHIQQHYTGRTRQVISLN